MKHAVKAAIAGAAAPGKSPVHQPELDGLLVPAVPRFPTRRALRPALAVSGLRGPEKYRLLEHRRRRAQIRARRLLDSADQSDGRVNLMSSASRRGDPL